MSKYKYGINRINNTEYSFYIKKRDFLFYHTVVEFDNASDFWDYIRDLKAAGNDVNYDFK